MSIIKLANVELPKEGSIVYCEQGVLCCRAIFRDGVFIGGGEYPEPEYIIDDVVRWFCFDEYREHHKGKGFFYVSFDAASKIN